MIDKIALAIVIIGAINWGLIGLFNYDLVAFLFGGALSMGSRIVYTIVAIAGIWCISMLFRGEEHMRESHA